MILALKAAFVQHRMGAHARQALVHIADRQPDALAQRIPEGARIDGLLAFRAVHVARQTQHKGGGSALPGQRLKMCKVVF